MNSTQDILIKQNIIEASPSDTLSGVISKLSSSHDAAFVFSEDDRFLGLINPYYALIKNSLPGNAKVEHCLYHPPKLQLDDSMDRVIHSLTDSKIHYLPVFDEKNIFRGIVSARGILKAYQHDKKFNIKISEVLKRKNKPIITVFEDDPISIALHFFKLHKISKLIVVSRENKLKGILSYYDLIHYLIAPKESEHMGDKEGGKTSFYHQPIKRFAKTYVLTLMENDTLHDALELVIEKKIGSVVVIDEQKRPIGIITSKDLLAAISQQINDIKVELHGEHLSHQNNRIVNTFFYHFSHLLKKIPHLNKASLSIKEEKNGGVFKVFLSLFPQKGKTEVFKREGKNLVYLLQEVKEGVKSKNSKQ